MTGVTSDPVDRPALYTPRLIAVCAVALLCFGQNFLLQPVLPLLVLERGGDATMIGIVFAVYSIPSILLRPVMGQLADRWGFEWNLLLGTLGIALLAPAYLLPGIPILLVVRILHGLAWAAFNTGGTSILARIAPPVRRVEASSLYDLMPAIGSLLMPSLGLLALQAAGFPAVFALATVLAGAAVLVGVTMFRPGTLPHDRQPRVPGTPRYLEPTAVLPMLVVLLFTSASSLFLVYPPLFAQQRGIPLVELAVYYPAYGLVLVAVRALMGRYIEGVPRSCVVAAGALIGGVGLLLGAAATSLLVLTLAAMTFALAYGFTPPTAQAVAMDRAPRPRLGAAMATYTLGFQIGSGLGAAVWGVLIGPIGLAGAFVIAAAIQVGLLALAMGRARELDVAAAPA